MFSCKPFIKSFRQMLYARHLVILLGKMTQIRGFYYTIAKIKSYSYSLLSLRTVLGEPTVFLLALVVWPKQRPDFHSRAFNLT